MKPWYNYNYNFKVLKFREKKIETFVTVILKIFVMLKFTGTINVN